MIEEDSIKQEAYWYRNKILEVTAYKNDTELDWQNIFPEICNRFADLASRNMERCRHIVAILLKDAIYDVRFGTLKLLQSLEVDMVQPLKMRDTALSLMVIHIAIKEEALRDQALWALWRVATYKVLPHIMQFAENGHYEALYMARHFLHTPEEIQQGIAIARKHLLSKEYALREASLFLLQKYSNIAIEAPQLLIAVQKYRDELFIDALKAASPELVLEPLKTIRSTIGKQYAEYKDLSSTIDFLEKKDQKMM